MKKAILLFVHVLCAAVVWAQPLNHRWAKSLGGSTDDEAQAITVTADGTVYVAGSFTSSSIVFGPTMNDIYYNEGGYDGYIARYNPDGSLRWAACVLGVSNQVMRSLAFDTATGYLYVTGATNATVAPTYSRIGVWASALPVTAGGSDILVMKIDTGTGALNSAVSFGGTGDDEPQALVLGSGNVYIAGSFSGTVNFCGSSGTCTPANVYQRSSAGGTDAFVLRLSAATLGTTGVVTYGSTGADMARDVTADNAGNFYAVGNFSGSVNFNPLYNAMNRTSAGGLDGFVLKANSNLGTLWVVSQGNTGSDWGSAVALDKDGDVYVAGLFEGANTSFDGYPVSSAGQWDGYVWHLTGNGDNRGVARLGSATGDQFNDIAIDADKNIYLLGYFTGNATLPGTPATTLVSTGSADVVVMKTDSAFGIKWSRRLGGTQSDDGRSLAISNNGDVVFCGAFRSANISLKPDGSASPLYSTEGGVDGFAVRWQQCATSTTITAQPALTTNLCTGAQLTLNVAATNATSYQWQKGSSNINGANSPTFTIPAAALADAGNYTVAVIGTCETVVSQTAVVNVSNPLSITLQPQAGAYCGGATPTLQIGTNLPVTTYQWYRNGAPVGTNAYQYAITTNNSTGNQAYYHVRVNNSCNTLFSDSVLVQFVPPVTISQNPVAAAACTGDNVQFSVGTTNGGTTSYTWYYNNSAIPNSNNDTLYLNGVSPTNSGSYAVVVQGGCGTANSSSATLAVAPSPVITTQPVEPGFVCTDAQVQLSVAASNATGYQWYKDGAAINGANSATYLEAAGTGNSVIRYFAVIAGSCGTATTDTVLAHFIEPLQITAQPADITACQGTQQVLQVQTTGGINYTYNWYNGGNLVATNAELELNNLSVADEGFYYVVIQGTCANATSNTATVTVIPLPNITAQPQAQTVLCAGNALALAVTADNTSGYQWYKSGVGAINGANSNTYAIPATDLTNTGDYTVVVTNTCGDVASNTASVTVNALPVPIITQAGAQLSTQNFSGYQWQLGGSDIATATSQTFTATQTGSYTVYVTDGNGCTATSAAVQVTISGIDDVWAQGISLYPNPAGNVLNITLGNKVDVTMATYSADGKLIETHTPATNFVTLDVSRYAQGVYILQVNKNGATTQYRFVKQ